MPDDLPHETFDATDLAAEANAKRDAARRERNDYRMIKVFKAWSEMVLSQPGSKI